MNEFASKQAPKRRSGSWWTATALLVLVAVLFVIAHHWQSLHPGMLWVAAFAEAGLVGGLADWFAVTAIFRHPLGIPLAHTAILRKEQGRIVDTIAEFIAREVFTEESVRLLVGKFQPSKQILIGVEKQWVNRGDLMIRGSREFLDKAFELNESEIKKSVGLFLKRRIVASELLSSALDGFLSSPDWQKKLQPFAGDLKDKLPSFAAIFEVKKIATPQQNTGLFSRIRKVAVKLSSNAAIDKMGKELDEASRNPEHQLWSVLREEIEAFSRGLKEDEALQERVNGVMKSFLEDEDLFEKVYDRLNVFLLDQREKIDVLLSSLADNAELHEQLDAKLVEHSPVLISSVQSGLQDAVKEVVGSWEPDHWIEKLENAVGNDLQYIRINGTLIGGVIGLLLHFLKQIL